MREHIGETNITKQTKDKIEIIEYNTYNNIKVKVIGTGEIIETTYDNFKRGAIKPKMSKTVFGVGIVGDDKARDKNGKYLDSYRRWQNMLGRCYDEKHKYLTYEDAKVCEEWLYYPNFKKWYNENYYEVGEERMELDKDILSKGNKVYSPDNCVFVPKLINSFFTKRGNGRGKYPLGVSLCKDTNRYRATMNYKGKGIKIGRFDTVEEAFLKYKECKEKYTKLLAEEYKNKIPQKLYEAMYKWEVEIDD